MKIFDFFKKKNVKNDYKQAQGLQTLYPIYSQFGNNIYRSDVVQQCINCIVREVKKLKPQHVLRKNDNFVTPVFDEIQNVLQNPNELMTTSDFLEKIVWQLFFNYNSFIIPAWENGKLTALFPVQPASVDFITNSNNELCVKLTFANNCEYIVKYADIIHVRYNYSINEFMGGNENGQPDHKALLEVLDLNKNVLESVKKGLTTSINGIVKYNSFIDDGKTEKAIKEITEKLQKNESGFLSLDFKADFIPIQKDVKFVDESTLRFIDEKILRCFGVSKEILTGKYTKEEYEAFFQKVIEPIIVSLSQSFTKCLFSRRESFGYGHEIIFNHKELSFMTMQEKIQWLTLASNVGAITINEMRAIIGYEPFTDEKLGNTPVMSKNFGNAEVVKDMGNVNES